MCGIETADVERWIGLGVTLRLRLLERLGERQLLLLHLRQDVVAGSVEDAIDAADLIAGERLAHHLDRGNATRHRRLEVERDRILLRDLREFGAVLGEQRLVSGHDMLLGVERGLDGLLRSTVLAADQLDEAVDRRILRELHRVIDPTHAREIDAAILGPRASRYRHHFDRPPCRISEPVAVRLDEMQQTRPHRAEASDTDLERFVHEEVELHRWGLQGVRRGPERPAVTAVAGLQVAPSIIRAAIAGFAAAPHGKSGRPTRTKQDRPAYSE